MVESDDARSEKDIVKTQPTSAASSRKSEEISNKEMVDNYVEDQTRRTSGKTNSHILSDTDYNPTSANTTPSLSKNPTSSEIAHVRNEIAQIQSVIANVKKEMVQIQRQQAVSSSPAHQPPSRPQSVNSDKTFIYESDSSQPERPKTSMDFVKMEQVLEDQKPATPKSILKPQSPFHRVVTPMPDDVIVEEPASDTPYDSNAEVQFDDELHHEIMISQGVDEVDESPQPEVYEPTTESVATTSKETEVEEDDDATIEAENAEYQRVFSPTPEEMIGSYQKTPTAVKRQPPLKRNHKVTPIRNPMPNIHQQSSVPGMIKTHKVNNSLFPSSLRRFERPKDAIQTCLTHLESSSWESVMEGLQIFVRLIRHHPEYVDVQNPSDDTSTCKAC